MNAQQFSEFLNKPSLLSGNAYDDMNQLLVQYPYCLNLYLLNLKKSQQLGHKDFDSLLRKTSIYSIDRSFLYKFMKYAREESSHPEDVLDLGALNDLEQLWDHKNISNWFAELAPKEAPPSLESLIFEDPQNIPEEAAHADIPEETSKIVMESDALDLQVTFPDHETPDTAISENIPQDAQYPQSDQHPATDVMDTTPESENTLEAIFVEEDSSGNAANPDHPELEQPIVPEAIQEFPEEEEESTHLIHMSQFLGEPEEETPEIPNTTESLVFHGEPFDDEEAIEFPIDELLNEHEIREPFPEHQHVEFEIANLTEIAPVEENIETKSPVNSYISWLRKFRYSDSFIPSAEQPIAPAVTGPIKSEPVSKPESNIPETNEDRTENEKELHSTGKKDKKAYQPVADIVEKSISESNDIATETLAELLAQQGRYKKAIQMYERLRLLFPEKSSFFADKIEKLKENIE